ncbi:MAG: hypothetical protein ACYDCO_10475 [Armatimonadota bacterium]
MRRVIMLISVCALLWGCLLTGAHAQQVTIANDNNLLDISLRDADLTTVLTALFNSTGGKYQVRLGSGVNGRIARLQLTQTPFDRALDAILGTDFSYTKQMQGDGGYLYTISGRQSVPTTTRMPSVFQAPAIGMPNFGGDAAPAGAFGGPAGAGAGFGGGSIISLGMGADATTAGDAAASESSVVKLIRVNYLDVALLSEALGGKSVDLFELMESANGGGNYNSGSGGSNRSNNSSGNRNSSRGGRNNNNNNNNGYNNNNNNNNNYNNNNNNNNNSSRSSNSRSNRRSNQNNN